MKTKKFTKKLGINKNTIANLSIDKMSSLNGRGRLSAVCKTATVCNPRECMTCVIVCTWGWECDETGPIVCP